MRTIALLLLGLLGIALGAGAYWWLGPGPQQAMAPALSLTDLEGEQHRLSDYRGQVVVMNFWATWCPPCIEEIPMLIEVQRERRDDGLRMLGPALDDAAPVQRFAEEYGMNYPVFADPNQIGPALSTMGDTQGALPYTVIIDRQGRMVERHHGKLDRAELESLIAPYL
ncbi:TlpA family protein disulfide reductase [Algiphilus sp.]|uniref:TlpA family protein disulfide reductase n=1 Tax=Algiphilus sp. TaxID=1872431 RepID=UPI003B517D91